MTTNVWVLLEEYVVLAAWLQKPTKTQLASMLPDVPPEVLEGLLLYQDQCNHGVNYSLSVVTAQ